jgi:hypothetical protein
MAAAANSHVSKTKNEAILNLVRTVSEGRRCILGKLKTQLRSQSNESGKTLW